MKYGSAPTWSSWPCVRKTAGSACRLHDSREGAKVIEDDLSQVLLVKGGGGMIHRHVVASIEDTESPVNARNRLLRKPARHRKAAQGHDHGRVNEVDLGIEVALTRFDLG